MGTCPRCSCEEVDLLDAAHGQSHMECPRCGTEWFNIAVVPEFDEGFWSAAAV